MDTRSYEIVHRIPVGKNVEFMRMSQDGSHAFVAYEPLVQRRAANRRQGQA